MRTMTDDELRGLLETLRRENAEAHAETRRELRRENVEAHTETRRELRHENAEAHTETRRYFDIALEAAKHETRLVAESVAQTRELLAREAEDIRSEMRRTAAETQAMFKFSHAELAN